jgi:hypothetical protein
MMKFQQIEVPMDPHTLSSVLSDLVDDEWESFDTLVIQRDTSEKVERVRLVPRGNRLTEVTETVFRTRRPDQR